MNDKSTTCLSRDGKPLTVFYSEHEAIDGANHANKGFKMNLSHYKCQKCGFWHLSPKNRQTPSINCSYCNKELYRTREAAEKRAKIIKKEKGIKLRVYECMHQAGWHLTKIK
jgi:DNA-directed RNA polymerase subunit RPC12/RpoP